MKSELLESLICYKGNTYKKIPVGSVVVILFINFVKMFLFVVTT
jgi:hypothetical protein